MGFSKSLITSVVIMSTFLTSFSYSALVGTIHTYETDSLSTEINRTGTTQISNLYTSYLTNLANAGQASQAIKIGDNNELKMSHTAARIKLKAYLACENNNRDHFSTQLWNLVFGKQDCKKKFYDAYHTLDHTRKVVRFLLDSHMQHEGFQKVHHQSTKYSEFYRQATSKIHRHPDHHQPIPIPFNGNRRTVQAAVNNMQSNLREDQAVIFEFDFVSGIYAAPPTHRYIAIFQDDRVTIYSPDLSTPYNMSSRDFANKFVVGLHKIWEGQRVQTIFYSYL